MMGMEMEKEMGKETGMVMEMVKEKVMVKAEEWLVVFQLWVVAMGRDQGSSVERMSQRQELGQRWVFGKQRR
jgi:hypothetical protein